MMRVIQTVGSLAPETGGPARSVPNLAMALAEEGVETVMLSIDLGDGYSPPLIPSHPKLRTIIVPSRIALGMRTVWVPDFRNALAALCREGGDLILHDHGIWLPQNGIAAHLAQRYNLPLLISPRGMLEPWAMEFHRIRKLIAWHLFQRQRFRQARMLHATSQSEAESIRARDLENPICVIPNGTLLPARAVKYDQEEVGKKRILFLSRIHPKKGLLNLVEAVSRLDLQGWELVIAGYDENSHQQEVEKAVLAAGLADVVKFHGPVPDQEKWDFYPRFDLFILPSFSENFGIVVAEALACGLPVITTTGTPWEDLARYNCGWWVDPTVEDLARAVREAVNLPQQIRKEMGERGRKLVGEKYSWQAIAKQMIEVYRYLLGKDDPPETVLIP